MTFLLLVAALIFLTLGQLLQKLAADSVADDASFFFRLAQRRELQWAVICMVLGTFCWILVLSRVEVSRVFPVLSLTFVLTTLIARFYLKEVVRPSRWLGVFLICAGVGILAGG